MAGVVLAWVFNCVFMIVVSGVQQQDHNALAWVVVRLAATCLALYVDPRFTSCPTFNTLTDTTWQAGCLFHVPLPGAASMESQACNRRSRGEERARSRMSISSTTALLALYLLLVSKTIIVDYQQCFKVIHKQEFQHLKKHDHYILYPVPASESLAPFIGIELSASPKAQACIVCTKPTTDSVIATNRNARSIGSLHDVGNPTSSVRPP